MDKYQHVDIFEDPRIEVTTESKVITSITNILQLTGLSVSGFVGITTFLLVMLSVAIPQTNGLQRPLVKGAATAKVELETVSGNISHVEGRDLQFFNDARSFSADPINFRAADDSVRILTDELEDIGVTFIHDPLKYTAAYLSGTSIHTGNFSGPRIISMQFEEHIRKVGFFIQSGDNVDTALLREARPVNIKITDSLGTLLFDAELSTCPKGEALCSAEFLGFESGSLIQDITITTPNPYNFALTALRIEKL